MLHLVRGWPGSGKSFYAHRLWDAQLIKGQNPIVFEADQYFSIEGEYIYDPAKVKAAHEQCQWRTRMSLPRYDHVIVANTFTRLWEMQPYFDMTDDVKVYRCSGEYQNVHGVPADMVKLMKDRMEDYPGKNMFPRKNDTASTKMAVERIFNLSQSSFVIYVNSKGEANFERPYKPKICLGVNSSLVRSFEVQGFVPLWFAKWLDKMFYQGSEDRFQQRQICYDKRNDNSLSS